MFRRLLFDLCRLLLFEVSLKQQMGASKDWQLSSPFA
jgi:hypothetical protein